MMRFASSISSGLYIFSPWLCTKFWKPPYGFVMEYFDGATYSDLEEVVEEDEDFLFGMGLKGYE